MTIDALERSAAAEFARQLVDAGHLSPAAMARAMRLHAENGDPIGFILISLGLVPEATIAEALAAHMGLPLAGPVDYPQEPLFEDDLSVRFLQQARVMPLGEADGRVVVGMVNPLDQTPLQALQLALGRKTEIRVCLPTEFERAFAQLYNGRPDARGADDAGPSPDEGDDDIERLKDLASEAPVIRLVNALIADAVEARASDIHIEPLEAALRVRYRIDGALREMDAPPRRLATAIVSRIKIMARLNIAERRLPQDGRIRATIRGRDVDLRVSTVPIMHGESVVLRVLDRASVQLDFSSLGFSPEDQGAFRAVLKKPNGILLVTGPTGSGKTTTLYASLTELNAPDTKIFTCEDPIEYHLPGINQVQVKPNINLTFAHVLRSILRQDPDIIMVGEIRDIETAEIAIQASLTGHLVLSTLHTNDAASAITRLLDMGAQDYLLTATVNAVVAQRLVRRLCRSCCAPYEVPAALADQLGLAALTGSGGPWRMHRPVGCPECGGGGYHGRTTILEIMPVTERIQSLILRKPDARSIARAAAEDGMRSLYEQGLLKALAGTTSLEEVLRVTRSQ
ncbi:MAG TPA: type II secretion system ATPase GspE [Azospirillum sp.]|nr:type II secretion system ATPase GspE [Azospirillum sp.]